MHMRDQRLAGNTLRFDAGAKRKPVVRVNDIEFFFLGDLATHRRIAHNLAHEVVTVYIAVASRSRNTFTGIRI